MSFFFRKQWFRDGKRRYKVIKRLIFPGTTLISDCFAIYKCLYDEEYKHYAVNHKLTFKDLVTGTHTNTIEKVHGDGLNANFEERGM